jgi:CarD family transcriptional regulator
MCRYQIGDKAIDKSGRIFSVESIQSKDFGMGASDYLVMKPCFSYDFTPDYRFFIPKDKADTILHPVLTKDEALALIDSLPSLELYPELGPRERKTQFQNVITSGERKDICRVIKTLTAYREKRKKENKPFSDFDHRLLDSLTAMLQNEMSIALSIPGKDLNAFIHDRTGTNLF